MTFSWILYKMTHWRGQSERLIKDQEEMQRQRDEYRYELGLSKGFKFRRKLKKIMVSSMFYQLGVVILILSGYLYYLTNKVAIILSVMGISSIVLNWVLNNYNKHSH